VTNDTGEVNWSPSAPLSASYFETHVPTSFLSMLVVLKEACYEDV